MPVDPYNDAVRARFENPAHAGDPDEDYAVSLVAEAAESARGARVVLTACVSDGVVREMRFRAWGCPHLIAAAELVCETCEGQRADQLGEPGTNELMERLSVPVLKTGRILLLEDALRGLKRQWQSL